MLENSAATSLLLRETDSDQLANRLDSLRKRGQRKWLKTYSTVADRLSSTSQKKLQLADLVMEDHIADMRYRKNSMNLVGRKD